MNERTGGLPVGLREGRGRRNEEKRWPEGLLKFVGSLLLSHVRHFECVWWPSTSKKASRICTFPVSRSKGMLLLLRCCCCNLLPAAFFFFFISSSSSFPYTHTIKMALRLLLSKQEECQERREKCPCGHTDDHLIRLARARSLSLSSTFLPYAQKRCNDATWKFVGTKTTHLKCCSRLFFIHLSRDWITRPPP